MVPGDVVIPLGFMLWRGMGSSPEKEKYSVAIITLAIPGSSNNPNKEFPAENSGLKS